MFESDEGSLNPTYPANSVYGAFLKSRGATTIGAYGYGVSPSSSRAANQNLVVRTRWRQSRVIDTSVPFGSTAFTSEALIAKQHHVDALVPEMDDNSNFTLAEAYKQAGIKIKAGLFATGYESDVINSRHGQRCRATTSTLSLGRGTFRMPVRNRCRRQWRNTQDGPRASSPPSAKTKPGLGRI